MSTAAEGELLCLFEPGVRVLCVKRDSPAPGVGPYKGWRGVVEYCRWVESGSLVELAVRWDERPAWTCIALFSGLREVYQHFIPEEGDVPF